MGLTELLNEGHELYFVTLHLKNVSQPTETMQEISATHELLNKALKEMRKFARTEKRELYFMRISGTKSDDATTPHQLHTHAIFSLIPDGEPMPSKSHPHRYQSETFQKIAEKYGLRVWISKVYSPKYLAQYMCRNLRQLNDAALSGHIDLPSGYNRVSFSQNWWKSDYLRNLAKRRAKRHTAVKVTSNDWKQLVPKLPEMSLLGDFLFIRCATSGWKCRQVHLSVVYCITMLSDEFKRNHALSSIGLFSSEKGGRGILDISGHEFSSIPQFEMSKHKSVNGGKS
ncbi:MAG: hypothetical protein IPK17_04720 [Chloroflexi bacterium]|uniref:hypothetical protein n=1 Tax=Candidatus Flexifilum breve TaxID=3140694 RepID=UPI0031347056|nr:hypothetical protein [Chloroflexota bacterium]